MVRTQYNYGLLNSFDVIIAIIIIILMVLLQYELIVEQLLAYEFTLTYFSLLLKIFYWDLS